MEHTQHHTQQIKQQQVVLYVTDRVAIQHPPIVSIKSILFNCILLFDRTQI